MQRQLKQEMHQFPYSISTQAKQLTAGKKPDQSHKSIDSSSAGEPDDYLVTSYKRKAKTLSSPLSRTTRALVMN